MDHGIGSDSISLLTGEDLDGPTNFENVPYTGEVGQTRSTDNEGMPRVDDQDILGTPAEVTEGTVHPNRLGDTTYSAERAFSWPGNPEVAANLPWTPESGREAPLEADDQEGGGAPLISTTTGADAASGAGKGAAIGAGAGIAAALAALFIPGIGWVLGGGALATAIAGAAAATAAGATAGGVFGYLKDQGVPDEVLVRYNETFDSGGAILAVTPTDKVPSSTVEAVLAKYQALNVDSYGADRFAS